MLSAFDLLALLLALTAAFGWVNQRFIRLPHSIGMLVMGLAASLVLVGLELAVPRQALDDPAVGAPVPVPDEQLRS